MQASSNIASAQPSFFQRVLRFWRGWCDYHHCYKVRVALVGDRVIRVFGSEPNFCPVCANEFEARRNARQ